MLTITMLALFEKKCPKSALTEIVVEPKMKPWIHIPHSHIITVLEQDPFLHMHFLGSDRRSLYAVHAAKDG